MKAPTKRAKTRWRDQLVATLPASSHPKIDEFLEAVATGIAGWHEWLRATPELQTEPERQKFVAQLLNTEKACAQIERALDGFDFAGRPGDDRHVMLQSELRQNHLRGSTDPMLAIYMHVDALKLACQTIRARFPKLAGKPQRADRRFVQHLAEEFECYLGVAPTAARSGVFFEFINTVLEDIGQSTIGEAKLRDCLADRKTLKGPAID